MAGIISFYTFMIQNYIKSDSPAGDLARDMKDDSGFPKRSISYEKIGHSELGVVTAKNDRI